MARQGNSFALLLDEEGDDVTTLIANVAAKVVSSPPVPVEKKQPQKKIQQPGSAPSAIGTESVRAERGRGRGGRGRGGSGRDGGQFGNGRANGYQRNNYGDSDGFAADDGTRGRGGRGRGRGGRGRGRGGFNEDRGFGNEGVQGYGGSDNQVQGGAGDGWEETGESQGRPFRNENRPFRNDYRNEGGERRSYGGERRRYFGDRDGGRYGKVEEQVASEKKEEQGDLKDQSGNNGNSNNVGEWAAAEITEVPKDADHDQKKPEQVASHDAADKKSPEEEEVDNEMTLDEYEKLLSDKRKALEALKTEERKVTLDKDFELMQVIEKKKQETLFIKLKSERDKLKKKDSLEKEEKARKPEPVNITEFLGDKYVGTAARGRGRGRGRGGSRGGRQGSEAAAAPAPRIEDPGQFPVLGGTAIKA
ncbi:hypothetical protein NE237_013375 [Protea cynaroides]|uniref:Hyaluronan/mRNA-binding protein domain-containing protein n=1 Tax=Protea cynaroides TaxID=273540 RepID=A0A9Q0H2V4_9MAGN|nr:hypothetical protein NE237_013375 [Protea cynaroides]